MIKNILFKVFYLSFSVLFFSFSEFNPYSSPDALHADLNNAKIVVSSNFSSESDMLSSSLYEKLQLDQKGLSAEALSLAIKGYEKLVNEGSINNTKYLTIVDLSQSSRNKRFFLLDIESKELVLQTFVAHGKNSGLDQAQQFSNRANSEASSLGFYVTKSTYRGKHGMSLKLSGVEEGFNNNAEARGIVVHGAAYVNAQRVNSGYMGRSQGCPALPQNQYAKVIQLIKDGSVLFIYNPDVSYLHHSSLLNS